jgi:ABC-2 type transport system permease protein
VSKIITVLVNEYLRAVRTKAFILGVLLTPVMFGAGLIAVAVAENSKDLTDRHFVVVDRSEVLLPTLTAAMEHRNANSLNDEDGEQDEPRWLIEAWVPADHPGERADQVLSKRVEDGELVGFLAIGANIPELEGEDREFAWFTDTPTYNDLPRYLGSTVNETVRQRRISAANIDADLVAELSVKQGLTTMGLVEVDDDGQVHDAEETDKIAEVIVPAGLAFLLFMLVMMSTPALMNNVLEEKMQRIAEVLVSAVTPFQLLMGKLLSAALVSLTLGVIYVGGVLIFVHTSDKVPPSVAEALGPGTLLLFGVFLVLNLLIFGSVFAGLGAACSEIQDTQTLLMPAMMLMIMPVMFVGPVIQSPDGTLATVLSFFPPATPMIMFMRASMPPGVAWWELPVAITLCVAFAIFSVWAAGRIFRVGILMQGKAPSWRELFSWLRAG